MCCFMQSNVTVVVFNFYSDGSCLFVSKKEGNKNSERNIRFKVVVFYNAGMSDNVCNLCRIRFIKNDNRRTHKEYPDVIYRY
ncbi:hypothetical protein SDC9_165987 [bioreactor metagenome]|uniref:Uncharacterized protein n=1 Tax=bioreactor metagenome TaxID=1076179 RepID=A0A645FXM1_9ZZZZ